MTKKNKLEIQRKKIHKPPEKKWSLHGYRIL